MSSANFADGSPAGSRTCEIRRPCEYFIKRLARRENPQGVLKRYVSKSVPTVSPPPQMLLLKLAEYNENVERNTFFIYLTIGFWLIILLYWIIEAKTNSQTDFRSEITSLAKLMFSFLIIYLPLLIGGWFAKELYANNNLTNILGVTLCALGIGFAIWARNILGINWSGKIMIQKEHSLIKEGPYDLVRHPQYTGLLIALLGTALMLGQIFGFVWCLFLMIGLIAKSKQEEKILANEFPKDYPEYKKRTRMLIPFIL
jgi:protein-S-isoprenylcysteine O-methyltransferase Ste14